MPKSKHGNIIPSFIATEVVVGLTQPAYAVTEGDTVMVCAQLQSGQLERSVAVSFSTSSDLGIHQITSLRGRKLFY